MTIPDLGQALGSLEFPPLSAPPPTPSVVGAGARLRVDSDGLALTAAGEVAFEGLRWADASAGDPRVTALGIERTLQAADATVVERAVVPFTGAVGYVEWTPNRRGPARLEWRVPMARSDPGSGPTWRTTDRGLVVEGGGRRLLFALSEPAALEARHGGGSLEVVVTVASAGRVMLAAASVGSGDEGRTDRIPGRPGIAVSGRESRIRRLLADRLAVEPSDGAAAGELAWATIELAAWEASALKVAGWPEAALAEASLASGGADAIRRLLTRTFREPPVGCPALAVLARYLSWTGDRSTVRTLWEPAMASLSRLDAGDPARPAVLAALAVAAEDIGAPAPARVGDTPEDSAGGAGQESGRLPGPGSTLDFTGRAAAEDGAAGWAATRVLRLVDSLGLEPDAPRGRLTMRPRLAGGYPDFRVLNLRVGGAVLDFGCVREGNTARFTLDPTRGMPPLQVAFEPRVAGTALERARVDGAAADLVPVREGEFLRVPVQLVLDHPRTVELELASDEH